MAKKILLVDDSSTARLTSRMIFSSKPNYTLISACDGKEGVDTATREKPDLILMDVVMPRMTGIEACRLLKQQPDTKRIPVILLTSRGEKDIADEGRAAGCTDFLTKPVDDDKLVALLKKHLGE